MVIVWSKPAREDLRLIHRTMTASARWPDSPANERRRLERLCRYISRPAVSEKRLSLTANGNVRYRLKSPYRDGTTHVIFIPGILPSTLRASLRLFKIARGDFVSRWILSPGWRPWCPSRA